MARIPTTEFCPQCETETPKDVLAKAGRVQTRVFQDLDTGKYECAKGHKVDLGPVMPVEEEVTHFHPDNNPLRTPIASQETRRQDPSPRIAPRISNAIAAAARSISGSAGERTGRPSSGTRLYG